MGNLLRITTQFSAIASNNVTSITVTNSGQVSDVLTGSANYGTASLIAQNWQYLDTGSVVSPFNYAFLKSAETGSTVIDIALLSGGVTKSFQTLSPGGFTLFESTRSLEARYLVRASGSNNATLQVCISSV